MSLLKLAIFLFFLIYFFLLTFIMTSQMIVLKLFFFFLFHLQNCLLDLYTLYLSTSAHIIPALLHCVPTAAAAPLFLVSSVVVHCRNDAIKKKEKHSSRFNYRWENLLRPQSVFFSYLPICSLFWYIFLLFYFFLTRSHFFNICDPRLIKTRNVREN